MAALSSSIAAAARRVVRSLTGPQTAPTRDDTFIELRCCLLLQTFAAGTDDEMGER
jgi:hypothetical protein